MATRVRPSGAQLVSASELPPYEAPVFPMNQEAQRELSAYVRAGKFNNVTKQLEEAQTLLTASAGEINDRLSNREAPLKKRKANTQAKEDEPTNDATAEWASVEQKVADFRARVDKMTERLDENMRKLIDTRKSVSFAKASIEAAANGARDAASTQISTQSQRRLRGDGNRSAENGTDETDAEQAPFSEEYPDFIPTDPAGLTVVNVAPIDLLRKHLKEETARYEQQPLSARYAENDGYVGFRGTVHDARHPDDEVELPPVSQWFAEDGTLVGITQMYGTNPAEDDGGDDDDDDIVIDRMVISTKCPLTMQEFREPLSSKKCRHAFEKSAILEMIRNSSVHVPAQPGQRRGPKAVQCPAAGCSELLTDHDLHTDKVFLRKLERLRRTQGMDDEEPTTHDLDDTVDVDIDEVVDCI